MDGVEWCAESGKCDGPHATADCPLYQFVPKPFCRWHDDDRGHIERLATALDEQRRRTVASVRLLLLWRQSGGALHGRPLAQQAAAIPEEVFHLILLGACPDAGLAAQWRAAFEVVAEHARLASHLGRRHAALTAWLARGGEEDAAGAFAEKLGDDYDGAKAAMARLARAPRGEARNRALRAAEAYAGAARRVLYAGRDSEDESDRGLCDTDGE